MFSIYGLEAARTLLTSTSLLVLKIDERLDNATLPGSKALLLAFIIKILDEASYDGVAK
jgi:hypothetical protein